MKDIPDYEGLYAIRQDGKIWSYRREKFIKTNGYVAFLHKDGKQQGILIRKLKASAFDNKPLVIERKLSGFSKKESRRRLYHGLEKGYLKRPDKCELCGELRKVEAHHFNYDEPFRVIWVCRNCHVKFHLK